MPGLLIMLADDNEESTGFAGALPDSLFALWAVLIIGMLGVLLWAVAS